jgi:Bardet-Biedl syndrome 4 protein
VPPPTLSPNRPPTRAMRSVQVSRALVLLGKHRQAIDVYDEAQKLACEDRELWHGKGACYAQLPDGGDR